MSQLNYYVTGNTAEGFINYLNSNLKDIEKIVVLKHESNKVKTKVIRNLLNHFDENMTIEVLLSPLGEKYLDGIIVREKSLAFISNRISLPDLNPIEFDLTDYLSETSSQDSEKAKQTFKSLTEESYEQFAQGLKIHDELESIYVNEMNFERADEIANEFINDLFTDINKKENTSTIYKRLFGTNTPEGAVNIVPELLSSINHAYFIKGRAGTGKSTFMKKVLAVCKDLGFDIEVYHCSFDPKSIDMVLVRELSFCIFDSTDPHEFFPEKEGHKVIDMYEETVTPGTDEKYADKIASVTSHYKSYMKKGIALLKEADQSLEKIEDKYVLTKEMEGKIVNEVLRQIS